MKIVSFDLMLWALPGQNGRKWALPNQGVRPMPHVDNTQTQHNG